MLVDNTFFLLQAQDNQKTRATTRYPSMFPRWLEKKRWTSWFHMRISKMSRSHRSVERVSRCDRGWFWTGAISSFWSLLPASSCSSRPCFLSSSFMTHSVRPTPNQVIKLNKSSTMQARLSTPTVFGPSLAFQESCYSQFATPLVPCLQTSATLALWSGTETTLVA